MDEGTYSEEERDNIFTTNNRSYDTVKRKSDSKISPLNNMGITFGGAARWSLSFITE